MQESQLHLETVMRCIGKRWSFLLAGQNFFCLCVCFCFVLPKPQDGHLRSVSELALTLHCRGVSEFLGIPGFHWRFWASRSPSCPSSSVVVILMAADGGGCR